MAKLHTLLSQGQGPAVLTQAITGLGGIGKTQIALAYCYRHFSEHGLIWWLRAETSAALAADFTLLAEPVGLDPAQDQETLIAGIRATLAAREGWLLVFDNAEDPAAVRSLLPRIGKGHVLITSRRIDWFGTARSLEIEVMQEGEAAQLLAGDDPEALAAAERAEAEALATELGCLPLALGQARAYTTETGKSLAGYRTLLAASRPKMLEKGQANPDYPASVAKTWQISVEGAERDCPAARPLLELLSFFSADPLPTAVLAALPEALPAGLQEELARDEAIAALKRFSLVRAEDDTLTVHRLVQAVTRDALDPATVKARADAAVRLMSAALPTPAREYRNWPAFSVLLPHALATAETATEVDACLGAAAQVLNAVAIYHKSRAAWNEAEPLYKRAISIEEKTLGSDHPYVGACLNNLGALYQEMNRLAEAEPLFERAIAIGKKTLGLEHPDLAVWLNNLAGLYRATKRIAEAEPLLEQVLEICKIALEPEDPLVATASNNLAVLFHETRRYAEAETLYQRVVDIAETTLPPEHPVLAMRLNNLAGLYRDSDRHAEAEPLFKRAIDIVDKAPPEGRPHRIQVRKNYGALLAKTGRRAEASALLAGAEGTEQ